MRLAAVYLPHFVFAAEVARRPELARVSLLIGDGDPPRRVLDCSPLEDVGVFRGMPIRQATSRAPHCLCLTPDIPYYEDFWRDALDALWQISPEVEDAGPGECYLNVDGLVPHYGGESQIGQAIVALLARRSLTAGVGIASGKFPARAAVIAGGPRVTVLAPNKEASFLAPLGVDTLPLGQDVIQRLRLLGLDELGDVALLSRSALVAQFGRGGDAIWQMANGIDTAPLVPRHPEVSLDEWISFDGPVVSVEVLIAAVSQLNSRLAVHLSGRGIRELVFRAILANGKTWQKRVVLREAVSEQERLLFIGKTTLREAPPPGPVVSLGLIASGLVGETGRQLGLGDKREKDNLREAMSQLKTRYGYSPLAHCVEVEPWSVIPEDRCLLVESDV